MPPTLVLRLQPGLDDHPGQLQADNPCAQRQDIGVVVLARKHGRIGLTADDRTDAFDLVGRDRHPHACTADQDSQVGLLRCNGRGNLLCK